MFNVLSPKFFAWCAQGKLNYLVETFCEGVKNLPFCKLSAFFTEPISPTAPTSYDPPPGEPEVEPPLVPELPKKFPKFISFKHTCKTGDNSWFNSTVLEYELGQAGEKYVRFCHNEMYYPAKPENTKTEEPMQLWPILLITFLAIFVITMFAALFWSFWLRQRVLGPGSTREQSSSRKGQDSLSSSKRSRLEFSSKGPRIIRKAAPTSGSVYSGRQTMRSF